MIPKDLRPLFWDTNVDNLNPAAYPDYTIGRVLEFGDQNAIDWMKRTFTRDQILEVLCTERRLSRKSANFWALVYGIPTQDIAALRVAL
jgi:hypothetical protein